MTSTCQRASRVEPALKKVESTRSHKSSWAYPVEKASKLLFYDGQRTTHVLFFYSMSPSPLLIIAVGTNLLILIEPVIRLCIWYGETSRRWSVPSLWRRTRQSKEEEKIVRTTILRRFFFRNISTKKSTARGVARGGGSAPPQETWENDNFKRFFVKIGWIVTFCQFFYYFDAQTALFPVKWRFLTLETVQFLKIFSTRFARRCLVCICQKILGAEPPPPRKKSWLAHIFWDILYNTAKLLELSSCQYDDEQCGKYPSVFKSEKPSLFFKTHLASLSWF